MATPLPDVANIEALKREIGVVPKRRRDDAIQEAWLAHLEGRDALAAVRTFNSKERRYEMRETSFSQIESDDSDESDF